MSDAVPATDAVTSPVLETIATAAFEVLHVTVRPVSTVPAASFTVAVSCCVAPTVSVTDAGLTSTVATGTGGMVTKVVSAFPSLVTMSPTVRVSGPT